MTIVDRVIIALADAARAGINATAVVLGEGQWRQAMKEADTEGVDVRLTGGRQMLGLHVLTSEKVSGPLVVADDVRHALQASGRFRAL